MTPGSWDILNFVFHKPPKGHNDPTACHNLAMDMLDNMFFEPFKSNQ